MIERLCYGKKRKKKKQETRETCITSTKKQEREKRWVAEKGKETKVTMVIKGERRCVSSLK